MSDSRVPAGLSTSGNSQSVQRKGNDVYRKCSTSALTEWQKTEALRGFRAGRSAHVVAMELGVRSAVVLELWLRDLHGKVNELRRAA